MVFTAKGLRPKVSRIQPIIKISSTRKSKTMLFDWYITERIFAKFAGENFLMGLSSIVTTPLDGARSPASPESKVDLPAPLGPITAESWPTSIVTSTSSIIFLPLRETVRPLADKDIKLVLLQSTTEKMVLPARS